MTMFKAKNSGDLSCFFENESKHFIAAAAPLYALFHARFNRV